MNLGPVEIIVFYLLAGGICAVVCASIAYQKNRDLVKAVMLGLFFNLIGILVVALQPARGESGDASGADGKRRCSVCGKHWAADALVGGICPVCERRRKTAHLKG
jgi:hypothetical protein